MNKLFGGAALAAAASAASLPRSDMSGNCGFQIQSSGGVDAVMGQFEDGQNRLNGSYAAATYYISNGGITDASGRPCIVTTTNDATHQFQCDENSPGGPTLGFSIASNGSIAFNGNDQFYACPYITEYNVYTQWLHGQDKCRPITLSTNSTCAAGSSGSGGSSSSAYSSATMQYSVSETAIVPGYGEQTASAPASSVETAPVESSKVSVPGYGSSVATSVSFESVSTPAASVPAYSAGSSSPVESSTVQGTDVQSYGTPASTTTPAVVTITYTVSASNCVCETSAIEVTSSATSTSVVVLPSASTATVPESSAPGVSGYGTSTPAESSSVESKTTSQSLSSSAPPSSIHYPLPSSSSITPQASKPIESSPVGSSSAVTSYSTQGFSSVPAVSSSIQETTCTESTTVASSSVPAGTTAASSASASCASAGSTDSQGRYSCNPAHSYPSGQTCVSENGCYYLSVSSSTSPSVLASITATSSASASASASCASAGSTDSQGRYSCNPAHSYPSGQTCVSENGCYYLSVSSSTSAPAQSASTGTLSLLTTTESALSTTCSETTSSAPSTTFATSSVPSAVKSVPSSSIASGTTPAGYQSKSVATSAVTSAPSSVVSATSTTATVCQTSLTGAYQTPHLITWISKDYPDTSYGSEYNATIDDDCSTLFNFDIPSDYEGKQCTVIFLFPKQEDLETSAWSWNGEGSIEFDLLSGTASEQTTYDTCPAKASTLNTIAIEAGNSYVVSTGACKAGETVTIEASSVNGLGLEYFEDWNPSSLGLYITAC